jgi:hypothetical protein
MGHWEREFNGLAGPRIQERRNHGDGWLRPGYSVHDTLQIAIYNSVRRVEGSLEMLGAPAQRNPSPSISFARSCGVHLTRDTAGYSFLVEDLIYPLAPCSLSRCCVSVNDTVRQRFCPDRLVTQWLIDCIWRHGCAYSTRPYCCKFLKSRYSWCPPSITDFNQATDVGYGLHLFP